MKLTPFAAASISLVLAAVAQPAVAAPADPAFLSAGAPADAPEGYTAMCSREEDLCDSPAADAGPIEPAVAVAAQPPASDTILPSPSKIAGGAQSASPCLVAPVNWMEGLAHGEFGEYAAWTSPMSRRRGAYAFATSFFDPWLEQSRCAAEPFATPSSVAPAPIAPAPIVATAAIENPRHDPAPVHDGSTDAARQQPSGFKLLRAVTRLVNGNIRQRTDMEVYGVGEYWNRPTLPGAGDCEDIAIEKRMVLVADGFDPSKLAYAVVYRHDIGLHVVLIARMDEGDYVLDSLSSKVRRWSAAPYKWLRMQTPGNPSAWTTVGAAGA